EQLRRAEGTVRHGVDGGEDAAVHGDQVRGEDHGHRLAGDVGQGLLDLRRVAVLADGVGRDALVALGEVRVKLGVAAGPGDAALAVHDDVVQVDVLAGHQRGQAEDRGLRVAAGGGDQPGGA